MLTDKEICLLFDTPCILKNNTKCSECNLYTSFCEFENQQKSTIK